MALTQKVILKTDQYTIPPVVHMVQNDTGRTLECTIADYQLATGTTAVLWCRKPTGVYYSYTGTVDVTNNKVTFALDDEDGAFNFGGTVLGQVKITASGLVVSTFNILFEVHPTNDGEITPEELPTWEQLREDIDTLETNLDTLSAHVDEVEDSIITDYDDLSNRPAINGVTLTGDQTAADLGLMPETEIDTAPTEDSDNLVTSGGVHAAITDAKDEIGVKLDSHSRRLDNLEAATSSLYAEDIDDDEAYQKTVPSGALPWGTVDMIGGKTVVWNQLRSGEQDYSVEAGAVTYFGSSEYPTLVTGHKYYARIQQLTTMGSVTRNTFAVTDGSGTLYENTSQNHNLTAGLRNWIFEPRTSINNGSVRYWVNDTDVDASYSGFRFFDLTQLFGAGNEPTTTDDPRIAWIEQYAEANPEFNSGELVSAKVDEVASSGRNLARFAGTGGLAGLTRVVDGSEVILDGTVVSGTHYSDMLAIDVNGTVTVKVYGLSSSGRFTVTKDGVFGFTITDDTPITFSYKGVIGGYLAVDTGTTVNNLKIKVQIETTTEATPYIKYHDPISHPIPPAILALPGYGWSAGDVYNYVDFKQKKYHKRVAAVDMGTLVWELLANEYGNYFHANIPTLIRGTGNGLCEKYPTVKISNWQAIPDKSLDCAYSAFTGARKAIIKDGSYTDTASFKSAMSGVMLYYELGTKEIIDISDILTDDFNVKVEAGGTLTFEQVDDVSLPVPNQTTLYTKV